MRHKLTQLHDIANSLLDVQPSDFANLFEFSGALKQAEIINAIAKEIALYGATTNDQQCHAIAKNLTKEGLAWLKTLVEHGEYWNEKGEIL